VTNYVRVNLVTRFFCTDCGSSLNLSYKPKDGVIVALNSSHEPTGAAMVAQNTFIEPCGKCVSDARKPLLAIKRALQSIEETRP